MENMISALLNLLLVSLPEELLWLIFTLIFMGRFDLLDFKRLKRNIKWLILPVIPTAILINCLIYIFQINGLIKTIIALIVFYPLVLHILKKNKKIEISHEKTWAFISCIMPLVIIGLTEEIYLGYIIHKFNITLQQLNHNVILNFGCSIPAKLFQLIIVSIFYIYNSQRNISKKIFIVLKDKTLLLIIAAYIGIILISTVGFIRLIGDQKILNIFNINMQIFITVISISLPLIFLSLCFALVHYLMSKNIKLQKYHQNMLDDIDR